ncbi:hypothetical protein [Saccharothrix algeriensis]|uniref:Uncharacterized protein n=1 Tax=Saccharothrix algeriensis TaxID=173560 RepID=A0A8T8HWY1_9PSEU|nr:hypothetical protein [Saccharothrix algeriensis]MBM7814721.1 hypothetical protein [Saccharothrix algeriensis]QTR03006.1 hypothetical protein J7S33_29115 [Saccharothrix algeriensis]
MDHEGTPAGSGAAERDEAAAAARDAADPFELEIVPGGEIKPYPATSKAIINDTKVLTSKIDYGDLWGRGQSNVKRYQSVRFDRQDPSKDHQNCQIQINERPSPSTVAGILVSLELEITKLKPGQKDYVQRKARDAMLRSLDQKTMMILRKKKA